MFCILERASFITLSLFSCSFTWFIGNLQVTAYNNLNIYKLLPYNTQFNCRIVCPDDKTFDNRIRMIVINMASWLVPTGKKTHQIGNGNSREFRASNVDSDAKCSVTKFAKTENQIKWSRS